MVTRDTTNHVCYCMPFDTVHSPHCITLLLAAGLAAGTEADASLQLLEARVQQAMSHLFGLFCCVLRVPYRQLLPFL